MGCILDHIDYITVENARACVSPPPDIFKFSRGSDRNRPGHQRMNRGLSMEWEVRELLGL